MIVPNVVKFASAGTRANKFATTSINSLFGATVAGLWLRANCLQRLWAVLCAECCSVCEDLMGGNGTMTGDYRIIFFMLADRMRSLRTCGSLIVPICLIPTRWRHIPLTPKIMLPHALTPTHRRDRSVPRPLPALPAVDTVQHTAAEPCPTHTDPDTVAVTVSTGVCLDPDSRHRRTHCSRDPSHAQTPTPSPSLS